MFFKLNEQNAAEYLASRGLVKPSEVNQATLLGGGVSNTLVRVETDAGCLVVKQALPQLRVEQYWPADRSRIFREKACLDTLSQILSPNEVPKAIFEDPDAYLFVMSCAPAESINWKEQLLAGEVDLGMTQRVGEMLGRIHSATWQNDAVRERFEDTQCFLQLRIDPYHREVARRCPDLADALEREAQKLLQSPWCLVHGDYSPKNVMEHQGRPFLLDFEVVHYGNPVFDLAFMLTHLTLKAVFNDQWQARYFQAIDRFWLGYAEQAAGLMPNTVNLEQDVLKQMGCLLLTRVDGKSPVEYLTAPAKKDLIRKLGREMLEAKIPTLAGLVDKAHAALAALPRLDNVARY